MNFKTTRKDVCTEKKNVRTKLMSLEKVMEAYFEETNHTTLKALLGWNDETSNVNADSLPWDMLHGVVKRALNLAYPYKLSKDDKGARKFARMQTHYYVNNGDIINGTFDEDKIVEVHNFVEEKDGKRIFAIATDNCLHAYVDKQNKKKCVNVKTPQVTVDKDTFYLSDNKTVAEFDTNHISWVRKKDGVWIICK